MIYCIGGIKGGSGKTTIAASIAVMLALAGRRVLLVDADEQLTASDFAAARAVELERRPGLVPLTTCSLVGRNVRNDGLRLAAAFDELVIDTGGRDTQSQRAAMTIAERYLVPVLPRSFDLWALDHTVELLEEIRVVNPGLVAFAFINRADPRGRQRDVIEVERAIEDMPSVELLAGVRIGNRKAIADAAGRGLFVGELERPDRRALDELVALGRQACGLERRALTIGLEKERAA